MEDIPYIKCQVCENLAKQLYQQVQKKQAEIAPKKISEFQIIEIAENVCNLKKVEAEWILHIDIVEKEDRLELAEQESEGQCNSECKTIERNCLEEFSAIAKLLSKDLQDRVAGEPFIPKSSREAEMENLLKSMEGMPGAPSVKTYPRDDLMNMQNFGDEDEDDDDDDEADFPSKLGKVLRDKNGRKSDWKQKLRKGFAEARMTLKRHANRVSNGIQQWWRLERKEDNYFKEGA